MTRIVVVGSANVDLVARVPYIPEPGETVIGTEFMQAMGGKGANQAVAAARLGAEVSLIARLGDDAYGETCLASYAESGVDTRAVQRTAGVSTGLALISVADNGENSIVVISGANAWLTPQDVQAHADLLTQADAILLQLEIPLETVSAAVEIAHQAGRRVILNPAPYRALPRTLLEKITVLTPNLPEAQHLLGTAMYEDTMMAKEILGAGPQNVIITLGGKGALVAGAWGQTHVDAYHVKAVDTTGAGDAFSAGLAVGLGEGLALDEAAKFAAGAAAVAVTRVGAQPSMPTREDVVALMQRG